MRFSSCILKLWQERYFSLCVLTFVYFSLLIKIFTHMYLQTHNKTQITYKFYGCDFVLSSLSTPNVSQASEDSASTQPVDHYHGGVLNLAPMDSDVFNQSVEYQNLCEMSSISIIFSDIKI